MVAVCGTGCPSDVSFTTHGVCVLPPGTTPLASIVTRRSLAGPCHQGRAGVVALERMLEDSGLAVASDAELTELNEAIALSRMGPKVEPKLEHIMTLEAWYREQDRARGSD